jgi:hypothetical protein
LPAIQPYILEPIWEQFCALLPEREVNYPLACHRPHIPNRVVFEKLVQVLVFGCHQKLAARGLRAEIADKGKPAPITAAKRWVVERAFS